MACTVLSESITQGLNQFGATVGVQNTGKTVNPRGTWNPPFFGNRGCTNLPMTGSVEDYNWQDLQDNIIVGDPSIQNSWAPFAQQAYYGPTPFPPGGVAPSLQVWPVNQPFTYSWQTAMADASLQMQLFVDDCALETTYGPNSPWAVVNPPSPGIPITPGQVPGCTYAYVVIAPLGTPTVTGRGGAQVLDACPMIVAELDGSGNTAPNYSQSVGYLGWGPCSYTTTIGYNPAGTPTFLWNLCPPGSTCTAAPPNTPPGTSPPIGTVGKIRLVRAVDLTPNSFTWLRGMQWLTQVHYLIPNINNNTHLYVASQIETKQVL